jgi:hypothetical protein
LGNFQRGLKIRSLFGANLPNGFPVISKFDSGTATLIKSMDLTAESYQDSGIVRDKLIEYIAKLAAYSGQPEPWGSDGITIRSEDIERKELLLVIPENPVAPEVIRAVEECGAYAALKGLDMKVVKYGTKIIKVDGESGKDGGGAER